jgi:hypothetical protein
VRVFSKATGAYGLQTPQLSPLPLVKERGEEGRRVNFISQPKLNECCLTLSESALSVPLFLGGYRIFLKARCVRVGQIRGILIRLIEHFSSAAGISGVFLDQFRD